MGKGDRRTRRGKVWRGTHGKSRSRKQQRLRARERHGPKRSQLGREKQGS